MPRPKADAPSYCLHRGSGRAYVTIDGRQITLPGLHNSPQSRAAYDRLLAEWLTSGRTLVNTSTGPTVAMIAAAFWRHAQTFYVDPQGKQTTEVGNIRQALRPLNKYYGDTPATDFGPKALKTLRACMLKPEEHIDPITNGKTITPGWSRTYCNSQISRIKLAFRWAAGEEMIPASIYHALDTVDSIRIGKEGARETEPVAPVDPAAVDATLPHLSPPVAALVKLQLLAGARGGELFPLRTCDIDRSGEVWKYRPTAHKTAHFGHSRTIYFGPQAQEVLRPFLKMDLAAFLFTPADSVAYWREQAAQARKTPVQPSQQLRAERAARRPKIFAPIFDRTSYARAIARACVRANQWEQGGKVVGNDEILVPHWHPHQLRHSAATNYRRDGDFESAKILLGHRTDSMTQRYAERDSRKAEALVAKIG